MKKTSMFLTTAFSILVASATCQNNLNSVSEPITEKATYKENLNKALWENLRYPEEAFLNKIQGDVIFSFVVKADGKMDDLNIISTPSEILSNSSFNSIIGLNDEWNPYKVNGVAIDKTYLLVFRYRVLTNSSQLEYEKKADKFIKKEKFEKALKVCNAAIEENKFDYKLFEKRAKTNKLLGNVENANKDLEQASKLKNSIISTIDVNVLSKKSSPRYLGTTIERVSDF